MGQVKRTPLFDLYREYGAKTIDFGGWELPVQFSSIKEEHKAVRTKVGLFDVSHMGEIVVKGKDSLAFLQKVATNDVSKLSVGMVQYTTLCYLNGGTVDDILIYKLEENYYWLVVNAANIDKDWKWLRKYAQYYKVELENKSEEIAQLALQGPLAETVLQKLTTSKLSELKPFRFSNNVVVKGTNVLLSRTGYTGEDGFELYCDVQNIAKLWRDLLEEEEVVPVGLGARDTLRFEAGLPLYGHELSANITPIEAGIGFVVKTEKEMDFVGKEALMEQKKYGASHKLVGIEMIERGIPRHGYPVYAGEKMIGHVTSGTQSPTLEKNVGYALIKSKYAVLNTDVMVEIRSKKVKAVIVETPFYKKQR